MAAHIEERDQAKPGTPWSAEGWRCAIALFKSSSEENFRVVGGEGKRDRDLTRGINYCPFCHKRCKVLSLQELARNCKIHRTWRSLISSGETFTGKAFPS